MSVCAGLCVDGTEREQSGRVNNKREAIRESRGNEHKRRSNPARGSRVIPKGSAGRKPSRRPLRGKKKRSRPVSLQRTFSIWPAFVAASCLRPCSVLSKPWRGAGVSYLFFFSFLFVRLFRGPNFSMTAGRQIKSCIDVLSSPFRSIGMLHPSQSV